MTFWQALKETVLEMLFGRERLQAWEDEKKQREECERASRVYSERWNGEFR